MAPLIYIKYGPSLQNIIPKYKRAERPLQYASHMVSTIACQAGQQKTLVYWKMYIAADETAIGTDADNFF